MQGLTAAPRTSLTADQVRATLTQQGVRRGFGAERVDTNGNVLEDISEWVHDPWKVTHDNTAQIHGGLSIALTREFAWGKDRFRPYMTLTYGGVAARFNAGVFVLSTPTRTYGRDPAVYQCSGKDLLSLANRQVADTYVVDAGTSYLSALRTALNNAGITATPLLDGGAQDTLLPYPMVWCLSNETWLSIADKLMEAIAYTDVWMDENGNPRAQPIMPVEQRPVEWPFNTSDKATDLLKADYVETQDLWGAYNQWKFVLANSATMPTEANGGVYVFTNQSDGLSSVDSIGLNPAPVQVLDVADPAALIAEGNRIIAADRRVEHTFRISVDPLPIAGHRDVVTLTNDRGVFKMQVSSWELTPYAKGTWVLGGGNGGTTDTTPVTSSATATVTQASPLRIVVDGATVDSPANSLDGAAYVVGDRVSIQIRNPVQPLVQGRETT